MKKLILFFALIFSVAVLNAQLRITQVAPGFTIQIPVNGVTVPLTGDLVVIKNYGSTTIDLTGYRICSKIKYATIEETTSAGTINPFDQEYISFTDLNLEPYSIANPDSALLDLSGRGTIVNLDAAGADVGLYSPTGLFTEASAMIDFVQYGTSGNGRESVAVTKGIWGAAEFVPVNALNVYTYNGDGSSNQHGVQYWQQTVSANQTQEEPGINVFPTLINNEFSVSVNNQTLSNSGNLLFQLFDITGKQTMSANINSTSTRLNSQGITPGLYIYTINDGIKTKSQGKLIFK